MLIIGVPFRVNECNLITRIPAPEECFFFLLFSFCSCQDRNQIPVALFGGVFFFFSVLGIYIYNFRPVTSWPWNKLKREFNSQLKKTFIRRGVKIHVALYVNELYCWYCGTIFLFSFFLFVVNTTESTSIFMYSQTV